MNIRIPIKGLSTRSTYDQGATYNLVNLRNKNGALVPVTKRGTKKVFSDYYSPVYVHATGAYEHWLGVRENTLYYYYDGVTEVPVALTPAIGEISLTSLGNVVSMLTSEGLKYLVWYEGEYKVINTLYDGTQNSTSLLPVGRVDLRVHLNGQAPIVYRAAEKTAYVEANARVAVKGLMAKAVGVEQRKGYFYGFALACVAIELYDGSYVLHSNPVLLNQSADRGSRYDLTLGEYASNPLVAYALKYGAIEIKDIPNIDNPIGSGVVYGVDSDNSFELITGMRQAVSGGTEKVYNTKSGNREDGGDAVFLYPYPYSGPAPYVANTFWDTLMDESDPGWSAAIVGVPDYMEAFDDYAEGSKFVYTHYNTSIPVKYLIQRTALRGDYIAHPNLIGYRDVYSYRYDCAIVRRSNIEFKINQPIDVSYKPLIRSIGVFMTPPVSMYKEDDELNRVSGLSGDGYLDSDNYLYKVKPNAEILEELMKQENFYRVHDIEFDDIVAGTWIKIELKDKLGDNLFSQPKLPVDPFSHHGLLPKKQYMYNSRLHALNYQTLLSRGFPIEYLSSYGGVEGSGQFWLPTYTINPGLVTYVRVGIKTEYGITEVVRNWVYNNKLPLAPIIAYPDRRAIWIEIHQEGSSSGSKNVAHNRYALTAHPYHNFAYYANEALKPYYQSSVLEVMSAATEVPSEINRAQIYDNGLKVSEVNNPFNFPLANTYSIGTGVAYNIGSNSMKVGERNFGQYPLYVITDSGVMALEVGTGGLAYSRISPVSTKRAVSDKILETPFGVIFISERGLYLITGNTVDHISPQLEQSRTTLDLQRIRPGLFTPGDISDPLFTAYIVNNLMTVLSDPDLLLAYNPYEDEVLLRRKADPYTFVLREGEFYLSTEVFEGVVGGRNTELLVYEKGLYPGMAYDVGVIAHTILIGEEGYIEGKYNFAVIAISPSMMSYDDTGEDVPSGYEMLTELNVDAYVAKNPDLYDGKSFWLQGSFGSSTAPVYEGGAINYELKTDLYYRLYVKRFSINTPRTKDYATELTDVQDCALIMQPVQMDQRGYKRVKRATVVGEFTGVQSLYYMLHGLLDERFGSAIHGLWIDEDGRPYIHKGSVIEGPYDLKDLQTGLLTNKYKSYVLSLGFTAEADTKIESIDYEVDAEYDNEKL